MYWIDKDDCVGCGICARRCPAGAINIIDRVAVIDSEKCRNCGICQNVCPRDAVRKDAEK